jgi:hypothetical protein
MEKFIVAVAENGKLLMNLTRIRTTHLVVRLYVEAVIKLGEMRTKTKLRVAS